MTSARHYSIHALILGLALLTISSAGCKSKPSKPAPKPGTAPAAATKPVPAKQTKPAEPGSVDRVLQRHVESYLRGYFAARPSLASGLGLHEYDGLVPDYSAGAFETERRRMRAYRGLLEAIPTTSLSPAGDIDRRILIAGIDAELEVWDTGYPGAPTNPMTYAGALNVSGYAKRNFAPAEQRLRSVVAIERRAGAIFAAARANLPVLLPKPHVETAIEVARGAAEFLQKDLPGAFPEVKNTTLLAEFKAVNLVAARELTNYAVWLERTRLPKAHQHYALGRDRYRRMLAGEFVDLNPEEVLEIGLKELRKERETFESVAHQLDSNRPPIEVFKAIQKEHPTAANLLNATRKNLDGIRQFLVDHKIVTLPSEERVRVEETLRFERATSFASMDSPGPFEKKAREAYYYVTPVEPEWPAAQQEEWLTAFNDYTTDIVSIHEAYPGHFTQFLWMNASPNASRLRKIFTSYAFAEGWAHYTEQMMLEQGFGAPTGPGADPRRALKYRLAQSDEALLRLCRLCVSIRMHCFDMTVEEATRFFQENCYYEEKPARQEALRGTFDPGYLYYTLGKLQFLKLREDWKRQEGEGFSLQRFHDQCLQHGAPPLRLLREVMLKDKAIWPAIL